MLGCIHLLFLSAGVDAIDSPRKDEPHQSWKADVSRRDSDAYPMTHRPRGWCLIVNNINFVAPDLPDRMGSEIDAKNLSKLFSDLGFNVKLVYDASVEKMKESVLDLAHTDHTNMDCLIVCLLSHGITGKIYGIDGELISLSELLSPFITSGNVRGLVGKPKLFFIQACRAPKRDEKPAKQTKDTARQPDSVGFEVITRGLTEETDQTATALEADSLIQESTMPLQADVLLSYSTLPGELSWRNEIRGSWFIDALVQVLEQYAASEDLVSMVIKVNNIVATKFGKDKHRTQIPAPLITLTKKLYLKA